MTYLLIAEVYKEAKRSAVAETLKGEILFAKDS